VKILLSYLREMGVAQNTTLLQVSVFLDLAFDWRSIAVSCDLGGVILFRYSDDIFTTAEL
jgi:hypothetical protein